METWGNFNERSEGDETRYLSRGFLLGFAGFGVPIGWFLVDFLEVS